MSTEGADDGSFDGRGLVVGPAREEGEAERERLGIGGGGGART